MTVGVGEGMALAALDHFAGIDPAKHARAIVKLPVARLRRAWPGVPIIVRADSGFCRWRLMSGCEGRDIGSILALAKSPRPVALAEPEIAKTWHRERQGIARLEHGPKGAGPRLVVTTLERDGHWTIFPSPATMRPAIEEPPPVD